MIWNLSNIISGIRALLAAPLAYSIISGNKLLAAVLIILIVASDVADGIAARKRNEVTEFGKFIDPLADKIVAGASGLCLYIGGYIPAWFFLSVIGRDIAILIVGAVATRKTKFILPSNYVGKLTVVMIALAMLASFMIPESLLNFPILLTTVAVMLYSLYNYGLRFVRYMKKHKL